MDAVMPIHDWAVNIGIWSYGFTQWGDSDCSIYFGTRIVKLDLSAPVVVAALLIIAVSVIAVSALLIRWRVRETFGGNHNTYA